MTGPGGPSPTVGPPVGDHDRVALLALSLAYAAAADRRDGDGLAALFVPDGELVVPDYPDDLRPVLVRSGHDAIGRIPGRLAHYAHTVHLVAGHRFTVDGDTATGEVDCVAHHVTSTPPPEPSVPIDAGRPAPGATDTVWFIRYGDRYRRSGEGWLIVRRELHLLWVEERPVARVGPAWP